jgi:hypothetical protein
VVLRDPPPPHKETEGIGCVALFISSISSAAIRRTPAFAEMTWWVGKVDTTNGILLEG